MKNRKNSFKYKTSLILLICSISLVVLSIPLIQLTVDYETSINNYLDTIDNSNDLMTNTLKKDGDIVKSYIRYARSVYNPNYKIRTEDILKAHEEIKTEFEKIIPEFATYIKTQKSHFYNLLYIIITQLSIALLLAITAILKFISIKRKYKYQEEQ